MQFENRRDERREWREERRRFRDEDRQRRWDEKGRYHYSRWENRSHSGRGNIWTGVFLVLIGTDYFLTENKILPEWTFSWEMFMIAMGGFLGLRHNFRGVTWFILMVIGGALLVKHYFSTFFPGINFDNIWPLAIIVFGLFIVFRSRRHQWRDHSANNSKEETPPKESTFFSHEDYIDSTSIFGGIKKNIISKNFKGGDITNIMGGSEIDLTQADINGTISIDLTQIFGGTKLIVPSNWQVKPQMAAIFGGVEDKRSIQNVTIDPNKVLILDGTSIFGGIEIRSY